MRANLPREGYRRAAGLAVVSPFAGSPAPGDMLVVWKLDRLSRSLRDVLTIMERLEEVGAGFHSATKVIDTPTPAGRMMMQMVVAFAEFERAMLRERTRAGLDTSQKGGRVGGRRPKLSAPQQAEIVRMVSCREKTATDSARLFRIHPAMASRMLARQSTKTQRSSMS